MHKILQVGHNSQFVPESIRRGTYFGLYSSKEKKQSEEVIVCVGEEGGWDGGGGQFVS